MAQEANAPPLEAQRQADGSFVLNLDDGSTKRWTRRPDGSWRKPEHRRAGFVGQLEMQKYVPRGALLERQVQEGSPPKVPGCAAPGRTPQAQKNERRKDARRERAEAKEDQRRAELAAPPARPGEEALPQQPQRPQAAGAARLLGSALGRATPPCGEASGAGGAAAGPRPGDAPPPGPDAAAADAQDADRVRKALEKKLRQVASLEERHASGERLDALQLAKMASRPELERQLGGLPEPAAGAGPYHPADAEGGVPAPLPSAG
ncbi:unnamed protein product [Prorocentrum cordatum]|uniref:Partner of Y14 and mago n=1 Tax=Prorocentrum cordatum TaxID=2364126 RepID=A0ABN9WDH5_9DINO|nr:unnamed protein product [Polarella glacialis]